MEWYVGDIHGELKALESIITLVSQHDKDPTFVFLGDYGDRGPHSKQVVDLIILTLPKKVTLRGNHDDVWDYLLSGTSAASLTQIIPLNASKGVICPGQLDKIITWWSQHGLIQFLASYGMSHHEITALVSGYPDSEIRHVLGKYIPKEHIDFYHNLQLFHETESEFAMHAYLSPDTYPSRFGITSNGVHPAECLWSQFSKSQLNYTHTFKWGKRGIFGHTPVSHYHDSKLKENYTDYYNWEPGSHYRIFSIITPQLVLLDNAVFDHNFEFNTLNAYCPIMEHLISVNYTGKVFYNKTILE